MNSIDFSKLDLAFILDTTASMSSYIDHAKQNITAICDEIVGSEKCNLRVGLVNYRDHPPQDVTYITQVNEFTDDILKMKNALTTTSAQGGGDFPESICCGFNDCLEKLDWRCDAVKVAILIADAPPHGLGCTGDSMPEGCPLKNDPVEIAHKMAKKGITLYCAGCEPALNSYRQFFIALCLITGGQYVSLQDAAHLSNVIVGGTREEISMEKMMAKVHNDLMREAAEKGKRIDEEELTKRVHEIINSKKSLDTISKLNTTDIEITQNIKEFSKTNNLEEMKLFAQKNNINLIKDLSFKSTFSIFAPSSFRKREIKKPSTKRTKSKINRKSKVTGKLAKPNSKKLSLLATGVRLRRSKRIKEIEERKKKTIQIENNTKKVVKKKKTSNKRKNKSISDCELSIGESDSKLETKSDSETNANTKGNRNKKLRTKSSSTEIVTESINEDECEELIDMDRARRMAKKVIARNFK